MVEAPRLLVLSDTEPAHPQPELPARTSSLGRGSPDRPAPPKRHLKALSGADLWHRLANPALYRPQEAEADFARAG
jgi:hypothetical protein